MSLPEPHQKSVSIPLDLLPKSEAEETNLPEAQFVSTDLISDENLSEESLMEIELDEAGEPSTISIWFWWMIALLAVGGGQLCWSIYQSMIDISWFGIGWGILLLSGVGLVSAGIFKELKSLKNLRQRYEDQRAVPYFSDPGVKHNATQFCERLIEQMSLQKQPCISQWKSALQSHDTDEEVIQLFEKIALHPIDQQVMRYISKECAAISLLVAASPLVLSDMLIVLWRSLRMIRKVAALYRVRLGYLSTIRLLRQVVKHIVFSGTTELLTELGTDWFHAEMAGKLSARFAQGLGSGMLAARLGVATVQMCRPIRLSKNTELTVGKIRKQVIRSLGHTAKSFFSEMSDIKQSERQK